MSSDRPLSTLQRLAGARPPTPDAAAADGGGHAPVLEQAFQVALQRVAQEMPALGLARIVARSRALSSDEVFSDLDPLSLCLVVDPPGPPQGAAVDPARLSARSGAIVLSPGLVDALIEAQTVGRVAGPQRPGRRPTRIDAALAQPFAREALAKGGALIPEEETLVPRPGALRVGTYVAGPGLLITLLTASRFVRLDIEMALGGDARTGAATVILPARQSASPVRERDPAAKRAAAAEWASDVARTMPQAPVRLDALITGLRLPLSELLALKEGMVLPLPEGCLSQLVLRGGGLGSTCANRRRSGSAPAIGGRLGQLNGARAIKLTDPPGTAEPAGEPATPAAAEAAASAPAPADSGIPALDDGRDPSELGLPPAV